MCISQDWSDHNHEVIWQLNEIFAPYPALHKNHHGTKHTDQGQITTSPSMHRVMGGDDASPLEVSSVKPTARNLESSAVNWGIGLNYKEFEDNRKWSFTTEVKNTHIHTFPPKSGKE